MVIYTPKALVWGVLFGLVSGLGKPANLPYRSIFGFLSSETKRTVANYWQIAGRLSGQYCRII